VTPAGPGTNPSGDLRRVGAPKARARSCRRQAGGRQHDLLCLRLRHGAVSTLLGNGFSEITLQLTLHFGKPRLPYPGRFPWAADLGRAAPRRAAARCGARSVSLSDAVCAARSHKSVAEVRAALLADRLAASQGR